MHLQNSIPLPPNDKTALVTTLSGLCGGMYKTLTFHPVLMDITLDGAVTVVGYAVLSATAGYLTKLALDALKNRFQ